MYTDIVYAYNTSKVQFTFRSESEKKRARASDENRSDLYE